MASNTLPDEEAGLHACSLCCSPCRVDDLYKQFPCPHAFCIGCSVALSDSRSDTVNNPGCPTCYSLAEGAFVGHGEDPGLCSWCREHPVSSYCFSCCRTMCSSCKVTHKQNEQFSRHVTTMLDKASITYMICKEHGFMYNTFCRDCMFVVCQMCLSFQHGDHNIVPFSACGPAKGHLDEEISSVHSDLSNISTNTEVATGEFLLEINTIQTDGSNDLLHGAGNIKPHLQVLLQQTKTKHNILQHFPQLRNLSLKTAVKVLLKFKEGLFITNFSELNSDRHCFIPRRAEDILIDFEDRPDLIGTETVQQTLLEFLNTLHGARSRFYDVTPTDLVCGSDGIQDNTAIAYFLPKQPAELVWTNKTRSSIIGIALQASGDIILVEGAFIFRKVKTYHLKDGSEHNLHADLDDGELIDGISIDVSTGGIAVCPRGTKYALVYRGDIHNRTQQKYQTDRAQGVAFTKDGNLVVGSWCSLPLLCFDVTSGVKLWSLATGHPCHYIAIDSTNRIIISDRRNTRKIHVYNNVGRIFSIPDSDDDAILRDPRGVCVDTRDNILVVDMKKEVVLLFDKGGQFVKELIKVPGKPKFIALYQDTFLYVATETKTISLYRVRL